MKTLGQISIADFVDILCGDCSSLGIDGLSERERNDAVRSLIDTYRSIADPSGTSGMVLEMSERLSAEGKNRLASLLGVLLAMGADDDVRDVLRIYGESGEGNLSDIVGRMLRSSEIEIKRLGKKEEEKPVQVQDYRSVYDAEFAFIMTHFRMTFDPKTLSASVYANMLHRADEEIKAAAAAARKMKARR